LYPGEKSFLSFFDNLFAALFSKNNYANNDQYEYFKYDKYTDDKDWYFIGDKKIIKKIGRSTSRRSIHLRVRLKRRIFGKNGIVTMIMIGMRMTGRIWTKSGGIGGIDAAVSNL